MTYRRYREQPTRRVSTGMHRQPRTRLQSFFFTHCMPAKLAEPRRMIVLDSLRGTPVGELAKSLKRGGSVVI